MTPAPLNTEQLDFFSAEGYLVAEGVFDDNDLQPVIDEICDEVDPTGARDMADAGELSQTYDQFGFETRLARISEENDKLARTIWNGVLCGPALFNLICHRKLLDIAEQICGPELIASSVYRLRPKIPHHERGPVPWHQDSGYFEPYCDKELVVSVWLPLVDATRERGCMWVLPRSHNRGVMRHYKPKPQAYLVIPPEEMSGEPVCLPVKKGDILVLTNRTPHASFENNNDVVRWSMDLRYQSAKLPTNAKITRLPDETVESLDDDVPPACYPPEADFLVRSRLRPDEVVTDPAEFARLRQTHMVRPVTNRW